MLIQVFALISRPERDNSVDFSLPKPGRLFHTALARGVVLDRCMEPVVVVDVEPAHCNGAHFLQRLDHLAERRMSACFANPSPFALRATRWRIPHPVRRGRTPTGWKCC
jgi:hypothetical protein